jgi:hypothetical protein
MRVLTASALSSAGRPSASRNSWSSSSGVNAGTTVDVEASGEVAIALKARASDSFFQLRNRSTGKRVSSESISLPQIAHSQSPLLGLLRSLDVRVASYRGPPSSAAVICAAVPTLEMRSSSCAGPTVVRPHSGLEQRCPTRPCSTLMVFAEKLSRTWRLYHHAKDNQQHSAALANH